MNELLKPKILREGYCCMHGYLELCKARGETVITMAVNLELHPKGQERKTRELIWREYRKNPHCCGFKDCLQPVIQELKNEKKPLERG